MNASECAAMRILFLMEPDFGDRKTWHSAAMWKVPAVWRKFMPTHLLLDLIQKGGF